MPTKHDDCATEPGNILVVGDGSGRWSAVCKSCATRWTSADTDVPSQVEGAVQVWREMTGGGTAR